VLSGYLLGGDHYTLLFSLAAVCYLGAMLLLVPWFGREAALLHHEVPSAIPQEQEISPYAGR
jgi:hypothetical protein